MSDVAVRFVGDLAMLGDPPPKLAKALAAIADQLHPTFARQPWIMHVNKSKESCVLCSLAVRDFLVSIGFIAAQVRSVATAMRAMRGDVQVHSLGIGMPEGVLDKRQGYWNGHMVVHVDGYLIDTTLYRAARPQWPGLAGMVAIPANPPYADLVYGLKPLAGAAFTLADESRFEIVYLDTPGNMTWKMGSDARHEGRRKDAVLAMRERFGEWRG